tara:strand:+ start:1199 stop:2254 length:1056 start_codon:yes stop_codon:yes gene_type:complete
MSDLLKEAIADAKAVRETALENAKMALEEAFTPHLKSMLSAKLSEEDVEEGMHDEDDPRREDDDEDDVDEMGMKPRREDDDEEGKDEGMHDDPRREDDDEDEVDEGEIIEIDGVKYAPVVEGEHEDDEKEDDMEEELDLESVIKELETEIAESENVDEELEEGDKPRREDDDEEKKDESVNEEEELEEEEEIDEQSTSSGIGKGTGVKMASASDEEDPGKGKIKESVEAMQNELNEYKEAVTFLREKLHEVNILNAKLLYTNRLFKEYVLSNDQKMKVVETFDRAQTTREIKLVYSTLAESFNDRGEINKKRSVKESASRKTNTTKPQTKIISEEDNVANRFKKLAGILKD